MMCSRILTPFFAVLVATSISAGDQPKGEHKEPPRPPAPEKLFERLDIDKDQVLSRAEFIRGMAELHRRAQQGGEKPGADGAGDGKRPIRPQLHDETVQKLGPPGGEGDARTLPGQLARDGGSDTRGGAGQENDPIPKRLSIHIKSHYAA